MRITFIPLGDKLMLVTQNHPLMRKWQPSSRWSSVNLWFSCKWHLHFKLMLSSHSFFSISQLFIPLRVRYIINNVKNISNKRRYIHIYDHHHPVEPQARISLTLPHDSSLSSISSGRSSGLYPVSVQSCCTLVRACRPALALLCEGVYRRTLFISLSLFF